MSWRGIPAPPYSMANYSGGHDQAERRYPYIDGASHEHTGRKPIPMQFKLMFLNTLREKMFPELFQLWQENFVEDGTIGDLEHPFLGKLTARPVDWSVELDATRASGVIMEVSFIETKQDLEQINFLGADFELKAAAKVADDGMKELKLTWPTGERTTSFSDLVGQINGLIFSARLTLQGIVNQMLGTLDRVIETIRGAATHPAWALLYVAKTIRNRVKDIGTTLGVNPRPTAKKTVAGRTSIDILALELRNTVSDLMSLNRPLLGRPDVPPNSTVTYYSA